MASELLFLPNISYQRYAIVEESMTVSSTRRILMPYIYTFLTATGLLGNGLVAIVLIQILRSGRFSHVYVYLLSLCVIDVLFMLTGPITITHMIVGSWIFDSNMCKLMFFSEGMHKSLTVYLLIGLTGDRYLATVYPLSSKVKRTIRAALIYVTLSSISVTIANTPLCAFAEITTYELEQQDFNQTLTLCNLHFPTLASFDNAYLESNQSSQLYYESTNALDKGIPSVWESSGTFYFIFMFGFYHLFPGCLILYFTVKILGRLPKKITGNRRQNASKRRVISLVFAVVILYFSCWSPYWVLQMFIRFSGVDPRDHDSVVTIATIIYTLPFLHSNMNAVVYAFLHKNLKQANSHKPDRGQLVLKDTRFTRV